MATWVSRAHSNSSKEYNDFTDETTWSPHTDNAGGITLDSDAIRTDCFNDECCRVFSCQSHKTEALNAPENGFSRGPSDHLELLSHVLTLARKIHERQCKTAFERRK